MPMKSSENTQTLVILLKDLARINNDRVEGYRKARQLADNYPDLSSLLHEKAKQSEDFISELEEQITALEGENKTDTSFAGKIFRIWMGIKNTLRTHTPTSILDSCEYGEAAAIKAYDEALHSDVKIPANIRQQILEQQTAIKKSQDLIRKYADLAIYRYNNSFT